MKLSSIDVVSQEAIRLDVEFIAKIMMDNEFAHLRPIIAMGANPLVALIIYESFGRSGVQIEQLRLSDSARLRLRSCRNECKVLSQDASVGELLSRSRDLIGAHRVAFKALHKGRRFGALWSLIQPDLGLFFRNGEFVSNTFTLHQDIGMSVEQARGMAKDSDPLGTSLFEESREYGQLIAIISYAIGLDSALLGSSEPAEHDCVEHFTYRDVRSRRWLGSAMRRLGTSDPRITYLLLTLLSRVQVARHLSDIYAAKMPWVQLKIKLIYAFHAIASIQKVVGYEARNPSLSLDARSNIRGLLGLESTKAVSKLRPLRNFAMHYSLDPEIITLMSGADTFDSLVAVVSPYSTVEDLLQVLDNNLASVSTQLSAYFDLSISRSL